MSTKEGNMIGKPRFTLYFKSKIKVANRNAHLKAIFYLKKQRRYILRVNENDK